MEYLTRYPKTISFLDGLKHNIDVDKKGVEQLHIVVKKSFDELMKIFTAEGFTKVKLADAAVAVFAGPFASSLFLPQPANAVPNSPAAKNNFIIDFIFCVFKIAVIS